MYQRNRVNGSECFPQARAHACIYICIYWWDLRSESLSGRQLRSGMSYRKWSRIRLPVRPIAPVGGGAAWCYGAQGDDNGKERGALDSAFRIYAAVLNRQHWLYQGSCLPGCWAVTGAFEFLQFLAVICSVCPLSEKLVIPNWFALALNTKMCWWANLQPVQRDNVWKHSVISLDTSLIWSCRAFFKCKTDCSIYRRGSDWAARNGGGGSGL